MIKAGGACPCRLFFGGPGSPHLGQTERPHRPWGHRGHGRDL